MTMILGIDASTSVTAFAICREDGQLVEDSSLTLKAEKYKTLYHKTDDVEKKLKELHEKYEITAVYIEEALMSFKFGSTSAQTLSLLHKYNGMVSNTVYRVFGLVPVHINSGTARKLAKVKKGSVVHQHTKSVPPTKVKVFEHLVKTEPQFKFLTTRHGNVKSEAYDRADAIICAKAGAAECQKNKKN